MFCLSPDIHASWDSVFDTDVKVLRGRKLLNIQNPYSILVHMFEGGKKTKKQNNADQTHEKI